MTRRTRDEEGNGRTDEEGDGQEPRARRVAAVGSRRGGAHGRRVCPPQYCWAQAGSCAAIVSTVRSPARPAPGEHLPACRSAFHLERRKRSRFVHPGRIIDEPGSGPTRTNTTRTTRKVAPMTLRQAQQVPGFYGRMVKPGTLESDRVPLEIVDVLFDLTIIDPRLENPTSILSRLQPTRRLGSDGLRPVDVRPEKHNCSHSDPRLHPTRGRPAPHDRVVAVRTPDLARLGAADGRAAGVYNHGDNQRCNRSTCSSRECVP